MRWFLDQEGLREVSLAQKLLRFCGILVVVLSIVAFLVFSFLEVGMGAAISLLALSFGFGLLLVDLRLIAKRKTGIRWLDRRFMSIAAWIWFVIGWLCIAGGLALFFLFVVYKSSKAEDGAQLVLLGFAALVFYEQLLSKQAFAYAKHLRQISVVAALWWRQRRS